MPQTITIQELLDAGAHYGSWTHTWNPAMKPYIHGKRNRIHIINLVHTVRGMVKATHFLREVAATGRQIVYVCTKRQMRGIVTSEAQRAEMPRVTERWLGGTLTNFKTVRSRLGRLEELEGLEESGQMAALKKKAQSRLSRELRRIRKNMDGLRTLNRVPGALLVIDPKREHIAIKEARRLGVPVVALLDTDCDPTTVDIPIPANDDSMRSVTLLLGALTDAIVEGSQRFKASGQAPEDAVGVRDASGTMMSVEQHDKLAAEMAASATQDTETLARSGAASKAAPEPGAQSDQPGEDVSAGGVAGQGSRAES